MNETFYTTYRTTDGFFRGRLYRLDETGEREINIHVTDECDTEEEASDAISDWIDDHDYNPELV